MITDIALHRLLAWVSPAYPTGAFSYSHGLEWAVEEGSVHSVDELCDYIIAVLSRGGGWVDAVLFAGAWRAADARDADTLSNVTELAGTFRGSAETALESHQQGAAFLQVTRRAWPHPLLNDFATAMAGKPIAHAVAMGVACAAHGIRLPVALSAYLHAMAANLVSAGVRLIPLGQTAGQKAIAQLAPEIERVAERALQTDFELDLGTAAPALERCSMLHETHYARLFRS